MRFFVALVILIVSFSRVTFVSYVDILFDLMCSYFGNCWLLKNDCLRLCMNHKYQMNNKRLLI